MAYKYKNCKHSWLNKKGGEKTFSVWWFVIITLVGLVIALGVYIFYTADVDIRRFESDILYNRVSSCILDNGFIDNMLKTDFDMFEECSLSEKVFRETSSFYISIRIYNETGSLLREKISAGTPVETECSIVLGTSTEEERPKAELFPRCAKKTEEALYYDNGEIKKATVEILTASNNIGKGVSL